MRDVVRICLVLLVATMAWQPSAWAQSDRAAAQALFDDAVALRDAGKISEACAKFEESLRLDAAVGTRFNLADCMERDGRYASAWSHFLEVASATQMAGQPDRAAVARDRASRVEPKLTRMSIVPAQPAPGLSITRNGTAVGAAQWSTPVPVDRGSYHIEASAPGKRTWSADVVAEGEGRVVTVEVPPLEDAPQPPPGAAPMPGVVPGSVPPPTTGDGGGWSAGEIAGLTIAGVGVIGIGVGSAFGLVAMSKKNRVDELCPDEKRCTAEGITTNDEAKTAGTISTIAFIAGGVLLVGGVVLWIAAPSGDDVARLELGPAMYGDAPGLMLRGAF